MKGAQGLFVVRISRYELVHEAGESWWPNSRETRRGDVPHAKEKGRAHHQPCMDRLVAGLALYNTSLAAGDRGPVPSRYASRNHRNTHKAVGPSHVRAAIAPTSTATVDMRW